MMLGVHIVDKYIFEINDVVMYHHRGSTCDPAGILILVLLTSNTQSFYDNSFILNCMDLHIWKKVVKKKKEKKCICNVM